MGVYSFLIKKGANFIRNKVQQNNEPTTPAPQKKKTTPQFI